MKSPHIGINFPEKPFHEHDCIKCKYMYSIECTKWKGEKIVDELKADVYESCDASHWKYLIRYSNEPSDYKTCDLKGIIADSVMYSKGMHL